ncbi:MAG: 2-phospho-L-lactate guanylyltransferase [Microlunatus sp.]
MDTPRTDRRVAALVALKPLPTAKSRLSGLSDAHRMQLARCMALDTIAALASAADEVLVVTDQPDFSAALSEHGITATIVSEPSILRADENSAEGEPSLNLALAHGDELLRSRGIDTVLTCVGDLPALRPQSVRRVLTDAAELAAAGRPRSFVADHTGFGTTMLIAHAVALGPRFGKGKQFGSAERHRLSGAAPIEAADTVDARWDVDSLADLRAVAALGVGPATATVLGALGVAAHSLGRRL